MNEIIMVPGGFFENSINSYFFKANYIIFFPYNITDKKKIDNKTNKWILGLQ